MFSDWSTGASRSLNLDGLVVYPGKPATDIAYAQVFRNGAMESARWVGALYVEDAQDKSAIPSGVLSDFVRDALTKFLAAAADWGITGPAAASVAVVDVAGWRLFYQPRGYYTQRNSSDRSNLVLPDVWIEQLNLVKNPDEIVRPLLDTLWQSFDIEGGLINMDRSLVFPSHTEIPSGFASRNPLRYSTSTPAFFHTVIT